MQGNHRNGFGTNLRLIFVKGNSDETTFKVVGWDSIFKILIEKKKTLQMVYSNQDIVDLATDIGALLYMAHTKAPLYDGRPSKDILDDIYCNEPEELQITV